MKYLFLLAVIAFVLWWLKSQRNKQSDDETSQSQQTQNMVRCVHCNLHLPQADALEGSQGFYCTPAHRDAKEG